MNYIPTNLKISLEWTVMKGVGNEAEDFSRSAVALFLFSEENRWAVPCVADYTGVVKAQLPETLAEGVYSLDLIWVKNDGFVKGSRCVQRTRKPCVFVVDAGTQPPAGYEGQPVTVEIRTVAAPYGYDGLSAYEIAVLRDATTLDEYEWSKGLFNDVLANELKRNQDEIAEAQEDIENGKKEVKILRKTVESLAASGGSGGGGASVASAVYFDNENTTLYGVNVQDAVEELSSKVDSAVSNVVPTTNDNGDCVLGVETFGHGEDPEYQELPMPKVSSYNDGVMSKEDKAKLDEAVLRLKDRPNTDGMGYVILRKDKTFAEQVTKPNTIYEIRYDFDLGRQELPVVLDTPFVLPSTGGAYYRTGDHINVEAGMTVDLPSGGVLFDSTLSAIIPAPYTPSSKKSLYVGKLQSEAALGQSCVYSLHKDVVIPENCVLKFEGGSINNGVIVGTNTKTINADFKCNLDGVFIEKNCIQIKYGPSIIDYTELINNIFSHFRFSNIVFDNAVYGINGSFIKERIGILINGNNNYHFNGCTFKQLNNNNKRSAIIFIENVSNISLGYFNIEGDARTHISTGSTDEWNAGIEIGSNVDNIRIHDVSVYDTTGDCIEIALYGSKKNIQVSRCRLNNGRRNYISIEAGDNIIIEDCIFTKDADFSVAPNCFIDIEPMKSEGGVPVRNVIIRNNYFNNIKQTSQGICIIAGFEDSVSNVNICNNLMVGNISLVGNINILGGYGSNIVIFNNTIKVTSLEYPYFESLRHIIGVNSASGEFYNNRIEGLQAGTVAFRVWNGGNAYIEGCTIKNARMLVGRGNTDEGISNMSLNNCIIENNNSESIFYSTYTHNVKIDKCNIKAKDTVILGLATYYDISNSTLLSETGSVIDDATYVGDVPMNDVKIKIRSSRLENQDYTKYVIIEQMASIIIQNSTIYGGDVAIFLPTKGNEYTATALIDNCIIKHLNSEGKPLLFDGLLSCNINNTNIDTTGTSYLYAKSNSVIFRNSHFTGLNSKNGILYSENFSAVDLINCTLNGIPINGRSEQEEAEEEEEEDYSDLTLLKSVKIYGGYRWNRDKKMPMWWNGKAWVDALGRPAGDTYNEVRHNINGTEIKVISTDAESQGLSIYAPTELENDGYVVAQQNNKAKFVDPADIGLK